MCHHRAYCALFGIVHFNSFQHALLQPMRLNILLRVNPPRLVVPWLPYLMLFIQLAGTLAPCSDSQLIPRVPPRKNAHRVYDGPPCGIAKEPISEAELYVDFRQRFEIVAYYNSRKYFAVQFWVGRRLVWAKVRRCHSRWAKLVP